MGQIRKSTSSTSHVHLGRWRPLLSTMCCFFNLLIYCLFVIYTEPCTAINFLKRVNMLLVIFLLPSNLSSEYDIFKTSYINVCTGNGISLFFILSKVFCYCFNVLIRMLLTFSIHFIPSILL